MQKTLQEVSTLRCVAIVSVVIWHVYCSYIHWGIAETPLNAFYAVFFKMMIPDANMPLFTILAGYLFAYLLKEKGNYVSFKSFIWTKIRRLFIPFVILGGGINLLEYGKSIEDLLYGTPNHLWYCLMLFYVYIVCWLVEMHFGQLYNVILMCVSFLVVMNCEEGVLHYKYMGGVFLPLYYYGYFYAGFLYRRKMSTASREGIIIKILCSIVAFFLLSLWGNDFILLRSILYFFIMYNITQIEQVREVLNRPEIRRNIDNLARYSFGIYVYHQWIIWNVTREPCCLSFIKPLLTEYFIAAPAVMFIVVFAISILLTNLSLRTKVGKFFLL